jgi:hypothetical protein
MSRILAALALPAILAGCAHQIVIAPDVTQLDAREVRPIERNVGYVITPTDREKVVTTPGGGGDKLTYAPYKELEPALFKVLSNVFRRAYPLASSSDAETIKAKDITFVFLSEILTDSSSESAFTWPPTKFKVELACRVLDRTGKVVWEKRVVGQGEATFDEFKTDMPLAARRASLKALAELQRELNSATELRTPGVATSAVDRN